MHMLDLPEVHGISCSIKHKQPVWCPNDSVRDGFCATEDRVASNIGRY